MKGTILAAVSGLNRSLGWGVMKSGRAKIPILALLVMGVFATPLPAAVSVIWGYVNARNWEVVYDWEVQEWIDEYFEDGSKGDGTVTSNIAMYFTQCFAGNWMENFNSTPWECGFVGACDNVIFTNAAIHAANVAGKDSTFKGYHDDAARELKPYNHSTTADPIEGIKAAHESGVAGKAADEKPLTQGSDRSLYGHAGTHVLVWMSHPHNLDQKDIENIVENYAPYVPAANITVLAGTGTGKYVDGIANKKNLLDAIKTIGAEMDDHANSQFVFFIGDHGGAQWGSHEVPFVVFAADHAILLSMITDQVFLKDHLPSPEALASVQLATMDEWADLSQLTVKLVSGQQELLAMPLDDPAVVVGTLKIPVGETTAVATSYQIPIENEVLRELGGEFEIELVNDSTEPVAVHFCSVTTGSIERAPQAGGELVRAFAFGSRQLECPTFNEPGVNYTMVHHGTPVDLEYNPAKGWGYEVLYPTGSPYGDRSGYGIFGPFDDSPNDRNKFADDCPEELYDSFIGCKDFTDECSATVIGDPDTPCSPTINPEGIIFRVDVPNGLYRFVGAFGDADNVHAHRIIAEDGGSGPPENIGPNHVVLVSNFDQAQQTIGEADAVNLGEGVYARVGFDGRIPPPGDGVAPSPQFVNMDQHGLATEGPANSPVLEVTQGYIRVHQLQGNSNDGPGGPRDGNGGDIVILELWKIEPPEMVCPTELVGVDIGGSQPEGTVEPIAICWRITAGGADIWGTADQFYYAYARGPVLGDFTAIVAHKGTEPAVRHGWAKAGIMVRESLEPGSRHTMVVCTPENGVALQGRDWPSAESWYIPVGLADWRIDEVDTVWLRLDRVGNTFTGSYAIGGEMPPEVWIASVSHEGEFPYPDGLIPGLATTSHEQGVPIEVTYTDLCIGPYAGPPVLVDPDLPMLTGPDDGYMAIREVIDNGTAPDQGACYASLASGGGTIVDYTASVLNIQDSGGNGNYGNDDVFAVVDMGYRAHGAVDDLSLIARGMIRIPPGQGGFWTFGVNSDDGCTLQLPGQNFLIGENGEIMNFESGAALRFYGNRPTADTLGLIELLPGDYPFWLTYHEGAVDAAVEFFAAKGVHTSFDPDPGTGGSPRLVGHQSIGTVPIPGFCNEVTMAASRPGGWGQIDSVQDAMDAVAEGEAHGTNSIRGCAVVNHSDPEDGAADPDVSGSFGADLVFPNDRPGDDDDFAVMVEGLLDIPAAGTYQIGFNSDDGAGIQIFGHSWKSIVPGSDATAVIAGDTGDWLITDALTGWSWTAGEIEFAAPGCYEFRAIMFERGGGSFFELFARGKGPRGWDPTWHLLKTGGARVCEDLDGLQLVAHPVAYWKLDEGVGIIAHDCSGYGHHGTLVGDPCWVVPAIPIHIPDPRVALQFDGIDDYVDTGSTENLVNWTVAAWVMSPAAPSADTPSGPVHREQNYQLNWNHGDATFRGAAAINVGGIWYAASYSPLEANTWYHLAATYDGSALRAYRDGMLITTNTAPSGPPSAEANSLKLGRHAAAEQYFTGTVDDVRIYNRALNPEQIADLARRVDCFPSAHPAYDDWLALGKPDCWCWPYQCDGDADGVHSGFPFNYRVFTGDLALITDNWIKKADDPTLNPCADIDHEDSGFPFYYRVFTNDLSIFVKNWMKKDADLPGNCPRPPLATIGELKGPGWEKYVGQIVTVEAVFVRDPLPMLVTDLDIVKVNMPMPEDEYIVLTGNNAWEVDPEVYGGAKVRVTGPVKAVDDPDDYAGEYVAMQVIDHELLERLEIYDPRIVELDINPTIRQPDRYAILFSGGVSSASNHIRYWNDLKFMYSTLVNEYGYMPANIAVLYADGKQPKDPKTGKTDTQIPVHYSGTQANLQTVFNLLKGITSTQDFIFVFTTNHGGGFEKDDVYSPLPLSRKYCGRHDAGGDEPATDVLKEADYKMDLNGDGKKTGQVSWDEELCGWQESIYDDAFPNMFANLKYDRMVIVMEQCFSGGLIADMAGSNRIIISAASEYEPSYAMGPYPYDTYDEFSYYFTCAVNGADPDGKTVDADTNNNGQVSMVEAFNYARTKDTASEHPQYEDNGDGISHSGSMPAGGDGTLGSNTTL